MMLTHYGFLRMMSTKTFSLSARMKMDCENNKVTRPGRESNPQSLKLEASKINTN